MTIYTTGQQIMSGNGLLLNVTATASNSAVVATAATGVYLVATVACFVELGGASTASNATGLYLEASNTQWFPFQGGQRISGVRSTADGILYIKPTTG